MKQKLENYEQLCPWCKGNARGISNDGGIWCCKLCYGKGKIDWIDKLKLGIKSHETES